MKKNIENFYDFLSKDKKLQEEILASPKGMAGKKTTENDLKSIIEDVILPEAKKRGFDFTVDELLEYEKAFDKGLSQDELDAVSGGVTPRVAGTILTLLTLGSGLASLGSGFVHAEGEGTSVSEQNTNVVTTKTPKPPAPPPMSPMPPPPPPPQKGALEMSQNKGETWRIDRGKHLAALRTGVTLKKVKMKTDEEKNEEKIAAKEKEVDEFRKMSVKDKARAMGGGKDIATDNGEIKDKKANFRQKKTRDIGTLPNQQLMGLFMIDVKTLSEEAQKISSQTIDEASTKNAKDLLPKYNELLGEIDAVAKRIVSQYREDKMSGDKTVFTMKDGVRSLRDAYKTLKTIYTAVRNQYLKLGLSPEGLGLRELPESPLPLPKEVSVGDITYIYSDDQGTLNVDRGKSHKKAVVTLEIMQKLGVNDEGMEVPESYTLDEDCSRIWAFEYKKDTGAKLIKRPGTPPMEEVYSAIDNGNLDALIQPLKANSSIKVTYESRPAVVAAGEYDKNGEGLRLDWKENNGKLESIRANSKIYFDKNTGYFDVKGSPVILELKDINTIESLSGKTFASIKCKQDKIILGKSLINAGWANTTGRFFGDYTFSKKVDAISISTDDVYLYKYKDDVYLEDNRDDKSETITLTEKDVDIIEKLGAEKVWSRSKINLSAGVKGWQSQNSLRYYGFAKK